MRLEDLLLLVCDGKGVVVIRVLVEWFIVFVRSLGAPQGNENRQGQAEDLKREKITMLWYTK